MKERHTSLRQAYNQLVNEEKQKKQDEIQRFDEEIKPVLDKFVQKFQKNKLFKRIGKIFSDGISIIADQEEFLHEKSNLEFSFGDSILNKREPHNEYFGKARINDGKIDWDFDPSNLFLYFDNKYKGRATAQQITQDLTKNSSVSLRFNSFVDKRIEYSSSSKRFTVAFNVEFLPDKKLGYQNPQIKITIGKHEIVFSNIENKFDETISQIAGFIKNRDYLVYDRLVRDDESLFSPRGGSGSGHDNFRIGMDIQSINHRGNKGESIT